MGRIKIKGTPTRALIDTGASVNVIDETMLRKLATRPKVIPTHARIYTYGGTTPLPLVGVVEVMVAHNTKVKTRFRVTKGSTGSY